jgi:hypothetical protein
LVFGPAAIVNSGKLGNGLTLKKQGVAAEHLETIGSSLRIQLLDQA